MSRGLPPRSTHLTPNSEAHIDVAIDQFDLKARKWFIRGLALQIWAFGAWKNEAAFLAWFDKVALEALDVMEKARRAPAIDAGV